MHQRLVDQEDGDNYAHSSLDFWSTLNEHGTLGCGGALNFDLTYRCLMNFRLGAAGKRVTGHEKENRGVGVAQS